MAPAPIPLTHQVSADDAVAQVASGDHLFVQGGAAAPTVLLEALCRRAPQLKNVLLYHLHCEGSAPHLQAAMRDHLHHVAFFIGATARAAVAEGRASYIPVFLSDIPRLITRGRVRIDTALIHVSPPDEHGFCSLGVSVDVTRAAVDVAKRIIAVINPQMPRTLGDTALHISRIHAAVWHDAPLPEIAPPELGPTERRIGQYVAELVPDGATLQLGIGSIPAAVAGALKGKRNLGVHTEMFTDAIVDLVEAGVITGTEKAVNRGKIVSTFLMGTKRLYDFVDDNPMVEMRPADYTNDTALIRRFRRMISINSAIELDLTGQVCADSIGPRLYSGVGGQMDFVRGAAMAEEGRAIIAMPATALGGTRSKLVPMLQTGAGVVTTRAHVDTVVTEYGIAELHGRTLGERAEALIAIAAPQFREELRHAAKQFGYA